MIELPAFANDDSARPISFGTGADGSFSDGPSQSGITVAGASITIDTDTKATFNFSDFTLSSGVTITVQGSQPLTIYVRGDATVAGIISLDGNAGGASGVSRVGGSAVAGGYAGGTGAAAGGAGAQPTAGSPTSGPSRGGSAGTNQAVANQPGGGGGCLGSGANAGSDGGGGGGAAAVCPNPQATIADSFESTFVGGGGGAGGAANSGAGPARNGAGGGSGGGAFHMTVKGSTTLSGTIRSRGGAGGNSAILGGDTDCGAGGGGGSGGAIWIQTNDTLSGAGTLNVSGGSGGDDSGACGYTGGSGSRGVIRLDTLTNSFSGTFTPSGSADQSYSVGHGSNLELEGGLFCAGAMSTKAWNSSSSHGPDGPRGAGATGSFTGPGNFALTLALIFLAYVVLRKAPLHHPIS